MGLHTETCGAQNCCINTRLPLQVYKVCSIHKVQGATIGSGCPWERIVIHFGEPGKGMRGMYMLTSTPLIPLVTRALHTITSTPMCVVYNLIGLQTGLAVVALSRSKEWSRVAFETSPDRCTLIGLGNKPFDHLVTAELVLGVWDSDVQTN